jgi:hypothetical protein
LCQYSLSKKLKKKSLERENLHKILLYEKAAHKMLVKLTPGVNFINILQVPFAPIFLCQKIPKPREKQRKALLYKNVACKTLVKLTPEGQMSGKKF